MSATGGTPQEPLLISQFDIPYQIRTIYPVSNNMAWICGFNTNAVELLDNTGKRQERLELDIEVYKVCIHSKTGKMFCCSHKDHSIRHVDTKTKTDTIRTTVMFKVDLEPWSICCFGDSDMIVADTEKLRIFTYEGQVTNTFTYNGTFYPYHVDICKDTNRIALTVDGVIVLDNSLKELYRYKGPAEQGERKEFLTFTSVFDRNKNLVIGDFHNGEIHIADGDTGNHIRTLQNNDIKKVLKLGVQDGLMWVVCEEPRKIFCFQYLDDN